MKVNGFKLSRNILNMGILGKRRQSFCSRLGLPSEYYYWLAEYSPIIPQKRVSPLDDLGHSSFTSGLRQFQRRTYFFCKESRAPIDVQLTKRINTVDVDRAGLAGVLQHPGGRNLINLKANSFLVCKERLAAQPMYFV